MNAEKVIRGAVRSLYRQFPADRYPTEDAVAEHIIGALAVEGYRVIKEPEDPDELARAAHHGYHMATKDWVLVPTWNAPNCLKDGWRAAAQAVLSKLT